MELYHFKNKPAFVFSSSFDENDHPSFVQFCNSLTDFLNDLTKSDCIEEAVKKFDSQFKDTGLENYGLIKCLALSLNSYTNTVRFYKKDSCHFLFDEAHQKLFSFTESKFLNAAEKTSLFECHDFSEVSLHNIIHDYFDNLCSYYLKEKKFLSLKKAQTFMIQFYPKDMKWLARRGLTHKYLGSYIEAVKDLEFYISLHDHNKIFSNYEESLINSAKEALVDLQGLKKAKRSIGQAFH